MGIGTAGEGSSKRASFAWTVKRNPERRYGFAMKGNKAKEKSWRKTELWAVHVRPSVMRVFYMWEGSKC